MGDVLERAVIRIEKHLSRCGLLGTREDDLDLSGEGDPESNLASSAVPQGQASRSRVNHRPPDRSPPRGGFALVKRTSATQTARTGLRQAAVSPEGRLRAAALDGFTLHAATRAGGLDADGREALLRHVLRPPIAQERVEQRPDGLVRITLKKAYAEREACPRGMGRSRSTWTHSLNRPGNSGGSNS